MNIDLTYTIRIKPKLLTAVKNKIRASSHILKTVDAYTQRTIQELLGHNSVKTTMIYTHVINKGAGIKSPLD